ncbi:MAG: hypothetical protein ACE5JM_03045 [Armatimonadota bacterium]
MKPKLAPILFAAVLVVLAFAIFRGKGREGLLGRGSEGTDKRPEPGDTVFAMVQAAQQGDTRTYLDCFWGPLRTRLEQTDTEMGRRAFGEHLARTAGEITGVTVHDPLEPVGSDVKLRAEMVYRDKNEVQEFILTQRRGRWRISEMTNPQRIKTIIPYGSEAYPLLPPTAEDAEESTE